jgi:hypothetical protein
MPRKMASSSIKQISRISREVRKPWTSAKKIIDDFDL